MIHDSNPSPQLSKKEERKKKKASSVRSKGMAVWGAGESCAGWECDRLDSERVGGIFYS